MTQSEPHSNATPMSIIGLGYVGLPLAVAFAEAGFRVVGIDTDRARVDAVNAGRTVTPDVPHQQVARLVDAGCLSASADYAPASGAELISICVPTPLGKSKDPDISHIVAACESLIPHVGKGTVVVLESTTYPGTTREIILPAFEEAGFTVGRDLYLAFSPERIDPGNVEWTVRNTPKVMGGITETCGARAAAFYARALGRVVRVSSAEAAEMVKLLENTFRSINIGLVNELAIVCNRLDLSIWEIIDAAATKPFGFMPFKPGPGLGGHCIPIDPLYLSWKMRTLDYKVRFIDLADEVNSGMPSYVVQRAVSILNRSSKAVRGSRVLLLGVAYKANVDDVRESPALDIYKELRRLGAEITIHDPHVGRFHLEGEEVIGAPKERALSEDYDLIVVVTDHEELDARAFVDKGVPILDTRNALRDCNEPHIHSL